MLDTLINNCSDFKKCDFRNMPRMNATIAKKPVKSLWAGLQYSNRMKMKVVQNLNIETC